MTGRAHDPERLRALLFPPARASGRRAFALLDGARDRSILPTLEARGASRTCLYKGELAPVLSAAAPWLVELDPEGAVTDWFCETAFGRAFGLVVETLAPIDAVARHLRGFLRVRGPAGERLLFRYYDPRVARLYLPTMNVEEARFVCGPLLRLVVETESGAGATEWLPVNDDVPRRVDHDLAPRPARRAG